jgi:two-component system sensor histidine kinase/response regulator
MEQGQAPQAQSGDPSEGPAHRPTQAVDPAAAVVRRIIEQPAEPPDDALDVAAALQRLEGDADLFRELAGLFLENAPEMMSRIARHLAEEDMEATAAAAHTLKGSVGNFAASRAFQAARNVEAAARDGDREGILACWNTLQDELLHLRAALVPYAQGAPVPQAE